MVVVMASYSPHTAQSSVSVYPKRLLTPKIAYPRVPRANAQNSDLRVSKDLSRPGFPTEKDYSSGKPQPELSEAQRGHRDISDTEKVSNIQWRYHKMMKMFWLWSQVHLYSSPSSATCNVGDLRQAPCLLWATGVQYESLSVTTGLSEQWLSSLSRTRQQ